MKSLKINISESTKAEAEKPTFIEPNLDRMRVSVPSSVNNIANWSLFPDEAGIRAVNNRSGEVFIGTTEQFNEKFIRGQ